MMRWIDSIKVIIAAVVFAAICAKGQTRPAPSLDSLSGISGPGSPFSLEGPVYRARMRVNSSAVSSGLIPNIRPLMDLHIRDTVICLGGDGNYYMTGSTGDDIWRKGDGIELWKSPDLKSWSYLGLVWSIARDGTEWNKNHTNPRYGVSIWAPEIHYIKKNYYLTYSMPPGDRGVLKSTTGKPQGPYVSAIAGDGRLMGSIDASLFEDDDGKVYLLSSSCSLALMKDDMSGLAEEMRTPTLVDPDTNPAHHSTTCAGARECKDIGHEGPFLFKKDGMYYLTAADSYEGRYSTMVAMSQNIYGPYKMRHEAVPCGGGTDYFKDKEGNWYCCFFGNDNQAPWREMPGIIKVDFESDGKIKIADEQPAWLLMTGAPTRWRKNR
jgi:xylan 1,4-beta-xylosidase